MILVDTSVWVNHFRAEEPRLIAALDAGEVLMHVFVVAELALGNLRRRDLLLQTLLQMPQAPVATETEVLTFIEGRRLHGEGLGHTDVHLLASARLAGVPLWSHDRRLSEAAERLGVGRSYSG